MGDTKMTVKDFLQMGGSLPSFYAPIFAVSPKAAGAIERLTHALDDFPNFMTDREGDSDEDGMGIPAGTMHVASLSAQDIVTEEHLRYKGFDLVVNETLSTLRQEMQSGAIQPGTIQYTLMNYTIDALEKMRRREYVATPSHKESEDFPGFLSSQKVANYSFTPKIKGFEKVTVTDEKGQEKEEYRYPEGYAENSTVDASFFMPRTDLETNAKYTTEELDASAKRINFDGLTSAASDYMTQMRQINNLIGMQAPETPEQERILKQHVLASLQKLKGEVSATMAVPMGDPVALRFFGDKLSQMEDTIIPNASKDRALGTDLKAINTYIDFLNSGMPVSAFTEYQDIRSAFYNVERAASSLMRYVDGMEDLEKKAASSLAHLLNPPKNMDEQTRSQWLSEIRQNLVACSEGLRKAGENPRFNEDTIRQETRKTIDDTFDRSYLMDQARALKIPKNQWDAYISEHKAGLVNDPAFPKAKEEAYEKEYAKKIAEITESLTSPEKSATRTINKIDTAILPDFDKIGKRNVRDRQKYITGMLRDMANDMNTIGKELTALAKQQKNLSPELKEAIAQVAEVGNPDRALSPKEFMQALTSAQSEAIIAGNPALEEYLAKNKAYFANRMEEAKSKGILMEESLNLQRASIIKSGRNNVDKALAMFNTKRSGIFGGRNTQYGKESTEHKNLREAATEYASLKQELLDKKQLEYTDPEAWKDLSMRVQQKAGDVAGLANKYFEKTKLSANSPAGKQRLAGAIELYRDAQITRVQLKRREAAAERYQEISKSTEKLLEANAVREQQLKEREDAFRMEAAAGQVQQQNAAKEHQNEQNGPQAAPKDPQVAPKEQKNVEVPKKAPENPAPPKREEGPKDTSFEEMQRKLLGDQPQHEFQRRRSVTTAPQMQGPEADNTIRRSGSFSK